MPIDIRELRVGNKIYGADNTVVITVDVGELVLLQRQPGVGMPIPLTIAILEKNGYKNISGWENDLYFKDNYTVMARFNKFQIAGIQYEIKYVHQLQNIHFVKTGKELEYKP